MTVVGRMIILAVLVVLLSSCTIHFKGKDIELDVERQRVDSNHTYQLEKICLFDG